MLVLQVGSHRVRMSRGFEANAPAFDRWCLEILWRCYEPLISDVSMCWDVLFQAGGFAHAKVWFAKAAECLGNLFKNFCRFSCAFECFVEKFEENVRLWNASLNVEQKLWAHSEQSVFDSCCCRSKIYTLILFLTRPFHNIVILSTCILSSNVFDAIIWVKEPSIVIYCYWITLAYMAIT